MVNGERIQKGSSYKLSDGDILSLGRSGTYKGVEFKAIIGKLSLGFPARDHDKAMYEHSSSMIKTLSCMSIAHT